MNKKRIAINGFGRIGRLTLRNLLLHQDIEIVGINDLTDNATLAHLFQFDSSQGFYEANVSSDEEYIYINDHKIKATAIKEPSELPWKVLEVDVVLECTGRFVTREKANGHINAGAKHVIISAPADTDIKTIVLGVNQHEVSKDIAIYSNASCTTNCLAPISKIIVDNWGIKIGTLNTVHAYTSDQNLQDAPHKDLRRARAAALNIVPTTTGAAKAAALVVPELKGRISSIALRVPVLAGSIIDFSVITEKMTSIEEINSVMKVAAETTYKNIIQYSDLPLVSSDIVGNRHSAIFDSDLTLVNKEQIRVYAWYDNESGYSARLADLTILLLNK